MRDSEPLQRPGPAGVTAPAASVNLWQPTRRQFIQIGAIGLASSAMPRRLFAAAARTLKFLAIGDWGRGGIADQLRVAALADQVARQEDCDFVVSTGDNFYNWGVGSIDAPEWRHSFENVYSPSLKRNWFSVLGNHDYSGNVGAQIAYRSPGWQPERSLPPPWGWRMDNRWWDLTLSHFGRPDVHLFFIDTVTWEGSESFPHKYLGDHVMPGYRQAQRKWLLASLRGSAAPIKLVIGHHPIYSIGPHGGEMKKKELDDILRYGGATAYIHGHDHCLYHVQKGGMNYICSGAGSRIGSRFTGGPNGCVLADFCPDPSAPETFLPIWRSYFAKGGVALFTIAASSVSFEFRTVNADVSPSVRIGARA